METTFIGTWEEIKAHEADFDGRRLQVTVLEASEETAVRERSKRLRRGLERAREIGKDFPPVSERRITLDFLYPDEDEPR